MILQYGRIKQSDQTILLNVCAKWSIQLELGLCLLLLNCAKWSVQLEQGDAFYLYPSITIVSIQKFKNERKQTILWKRQKTKQTKNKLKGDNLPAP